MNSTSGAIPAHNIFTFDDITFSSNFDNGNLARVERIASRPYDFKIWTAPDNMGTDVQSKHCSWFHFVVTGLPLGCVIRIQIVNASNHGGLYKHDMVRYSTNLFYVCVRITTAPTVRLFLNLFEFLCFKLLLV